MAVALSWKGYVDTDLKLSEFVASSHTIMLRFMPQFPNAYEGPFVAENGTGTFVIGQGDFARGAERTKLYVAFASESATYGTPISRGTWHHLALACSVTATQRIFTVYFDGAVLGGPFTVPTSAALPNGTLRFGRRTNGQTINGHVGQFYGFLDDIAIFSRALSATEIKTIQANVFQLTGKESSLIAGYTFATGTLPARLARPIALHGAAARVNTSATRDSAADRKHLPLPTRHEPMDLPFKPGESWAVVQGVDSDEGSHQGYASFCWDFKIADRPQDDIYPLGSRNAPFYAAAPGTVITANEGASSGGSDSNIVEVEQAPGEIAAYIHLAKNSAVPKKEAVVTMGTLLALASDSGTDNCHLHFATNDKKDQTDGFVTFPIAFSDYQVRLGTFWMNVQRGMPTDNQVIRIPPTPTFGRHSLQVGNAIARDDSRLDLIASDVDGRAWLARWAPKRYVRNWDRWRPVLSDIASPKTPVTVVSRDAHKLDVFIAGSDAKSYTGGWDDRVNAGQWGGWWNVLTGSVPPGGVITAVSRGPDNLDIFHVSTDGGVYTAAWEHDVEDGRWRGWWRIGTMIAKPGTPVTAVTRSANNLDIFVAGIDGKTYTAAWDRNVSNGEWRGWRNILTGKIPSGGTITAVSRDPNTLDIFHVSTDGGVYWAAWDRLVANGEWRGWWRIGDVVAEPGTAVAAVSRVPEKLDLFVAGNDGRVHTAAWQQGGDWHGWWLLPALVVPAGTAVAAVSRDANKLDVFVSTFDGNIYTAAWDHFAGGGQWQGWWRIGS